MRRDRAVRANRFREISSCCDTVATTTIIHDVWESLKAFLLALGDDVQMRELEHFVAFRRLKHFARVKVRGKDIYRSGRDSICPQ